MEKRTDKALSGQKIACVILAAGAARRFGSAKMLHPMPNGQTMIEQSISQYLKAFCDIHLVVNEQDEGIKSCLKAFASKVLERDSGSKTAPKLHVVECSDANQGMSQSIVAGVQATLDADGWLIGLGDMPYVANSTIVEMKKRIGISNIVMPQYQNTLGNPVGFGSCFKEELLDLSGDKGGKSITQKHKGRVTVYTTQDRGVLADIDTPLDVWL